MTYYTKCGREFTRSTKAVVTGYHLTEAPEEQIRDEQCKSCPFVVDVKEGWPQTHKRYECRAGSQPPNHENTYRGRASDKCTMQIDSLDHELLEQIRAWCVEHPDLGAAYNADCLADCRRSLSVSCSQNRKGMAAKQELLDKFFAAVSEMPDTAEEQKSWAELMEGESMTEDTCADCLYFNESSLLCDTGDKPKKVNSTNKACFNFCPAKSTSLSTFGSGIPEEDHEEDDYDDEDELESMDLEDQLDTLLEAGDAEDKKKPRVYRGGCEEMREDCPCFCKHNDGCAVRLARGKALEALVKDFNRKFQIDCEVFRKVAQSVFGDRKAVEVQPKAAELAEVSPAETPAAAFDYSQVDEDTADYLQTKASIITEIRIRSVIAIGKELKEAQNRLANHNAGTFEKWVKSIGISDQTARNYINGFEWVGKNFANLEDATDIQPSLLFAASKPSAPPELAQAVVDGDITKHKDYIKALEKLKLAEKDAEVWRATSREAEAAAIARAKERDFESKKAADNWKMVRELEQQLGQAKRNADPAKVKELGEIVREKQAEIAELEQRLKDRPIEIPAVEIREVVPESVAAAWCANLQMAIYQLADLSDDDLTRIVQRIGLDNYAVLKQDFRLNAMKAKETMDRLISLILSVPAPAAEFVKWAEGYHDSN